MPEFELDGIVPWGRTAQEYEQFFDLARLVPGARILDCGGGPSSFAAEYAERGFRTVSIDPIFAFSPDAIRGRFDATVDAMVEGMRRAHARLNWSYYGSPEQVVELRRLALSRVLEDRAAPTARAAYVCGALPGLPFAAASFDLALCSHLLFLYSEDLSLDFHLRAARELLRVANEVQVFPLLDMEGRESSHLEPLVSELAPECEVELLPLAFEFQRGGGRMLRLRARADSRGVT